ncbi:MAG: hypothetical protein L0L07_05930 [Staphylococcus equorum]|nr:hypothetical protein [Staphylococcus equorum]
MNELYMVVYGIFFILFIAVLGIWIKVLTLQEKMNEHYPTGGLKEQPKGNCIKSGNDFEKRLTNSYYRDRLGKENGYILKIKDNEGETVWCGTKESMLEILRFNRCEYEECDASFNFEIYPMTQKNGGK